jgi:hypothetical protein
MNEQAPQMNVPHLAKILRDDANAGAPRFAVRAEIGDFQVLQVPKFDVAEQKRIKHLARAINAGKCAETVFAGMNRMIPIPRTLRRKLASVTRPSLKKNPVTRLKHLLVDPRQSSPRVRS